MTTFITAVWVLLPIKHGLIILVMAQPKLAGPLCVFPFTWDATCEYNVKYICYFPLILSCQWLVQPLQAHMLLLTKEDPFSIKWVCLAYEPWCIIIWLNPSWSRPARTSLSACVALVQWSLAFLLFLLNYQLPVITYISWLTEKCSALARN